MRGELSFAGESGSTSDGDGAAGGVESSTYVIEFGEQGGVPPSASVPAAQSVGCESSGTVSVRPGEVKAAFVPCAIGAPLQAALVYTLTVTTSAGAVPLISGALSFAGESGSVSVSVGGPGVTVVAPEPRLKAVSP